MIFKNISCCYCYCNRCWLWQNFCQLLFFKTLSPDGCLHLHKTAYVTCAHDSCCKKSIGWISTRKHHLLSILPLLHRQQGKNLRQMCDQRTQQFPIGRHSFATRLVFIVSNNHLILCSNVILCLVCKERDQKYRYQTQRSYCVILLQL